MAELKYTAEKQALLAKDLKPFSGFDLKHTKDTLEDMLNHISRNGMFCEYTKHDIDHVDAMLELLDIIIPEKVQKEVLTPVDWLLIVLSIYFHDLGMLITQYEYDKRDEDASFIEYCRNIDQKQYNQYTGENREKKIYETYVREYHGERIYHWLMNFGEGHDSSNPVHKLLYDIFHSLNCEKFIENLAFICRSHTEELGIDERNLDPYMQYGQGNRLTANLLYCAAILRTADLLNVNTSRTPETDFILISPKDAYSKREWIAQKSITCIAVRKERNEDGHIDSNLEEHCFTVRGCFTDDDAYSHFMAYLDYAEKELRRTREICKESSRKRNDGYCFPWDGIDRDKIETKGFCSEKLKFELDKDSILKLLIGHTLYSDANVVLRELTQNAIDAGRYKRILEKSGSSYEPKVHIIWDSHSRTLTIKDNGTGMDENIIFNYLFKVGSSRYQDPEFKKENPSFHSISRFGIGLLTCFMISDYIEITTLCYTEKNRFAHLIKIRNVEGEYIMRNDAPVSDILEQKHGSTFKLHVREDVVFDEIEENLRKWIIIPNCKVTLTIDGTDKEIGYKDEKTVLEKFLSKVGLENSPNYRIRTFSEGCTTISFLQKKSEMYGYWNIVPFNNFSVDSECPVGICVEGIMVSENTPGYNCKRYIVLANCKGNDSPTTNVARDRLEDSPQMKEVLRHIYKQYLKLVNEQISHLSQQYTLAWSITEAAYTLDRLCNMHNDRNVLTEMDIFKQCVEAENIVMVDDGKTCSLTTINDMPENIWTIESQAYSSAVNLIQEIRDCKKTPLGIIKELITDSLDKVDRVYADNYFYHYISELFLQSFQVKDIRVDVEARRIEFCWQKKGCYWNCIIPSNYVRYNRSLLRFYIQREDVDVNVENLDNDSIIKSRVGTFILKGNPLAKFLNDLIAQKNENTQNAVEIITEYIGKSFLPNKTFKENDFNNFFNSDENFMNKELWSIVDRNELLSVLSQVNSVCVDFNKFYRNSFYLG